MGPRLVRIAAAAAERLADQGAARENARIAATRLAQGRVDRLEVENYLAQHVRSHPCASGCRTRLARATARPADTPAGATSPLHGVVGPLPVPGRRRHGGHMSTEERIARLEGQIEELRARQAELHNQLAQAQLDQWQGRVEDLEVQLHLASMDANDRAAALMQQVRGRWTDVRRQLDDATVTVSSIGGTLREGLEKAVRDLRQAILESKNKLVP